MKELRTPHSTGGFSQCNKTRDIIGIKIEKETLDLLLNNNIIVQMKKSFETKLQINDWN